MTTRTDVSINYSISPRILEVAAPSTQFIAQDSVDTFRKVEDSFRGMSETKLLDASGKEDLGGGTLVGITTAQQDVQIAFESRLTPTSTTTVTTGDVNGVLLIDSAATFVSDGVTRGAVVVNFDDESITEVLTVDSETQCTCRVLRAGTTNQFGVSDNCKVWNVIQCDLGGGNQTAVDTVPSSISPVFPTAFTQIVRTSSSSATLQEITEIQDQSYTDARVFIDTVNGSPGTLYPSGTTTSPVDNFTDAEIIVASRSFPERFLLNGSLTLGSEDITAHNFLGISNVNTILNLGTATTLDSVFERCHLQGTVNGTVYCRDCIIENVSEFEGFLFDGALAGTITLAGEAHFVNAHSAASGDNSITVDYQSLAITAFFPNWSGNIIIDNHAHASAVTSFDMAGGKITLNASCTDGTIVVRGVGILIDNSGAGCTVINELVRADELIKIHEVLRNKLITDPTTGIATLYDTDGTTPLLTMQLYEDAAGAQTYRGQGAERRERLE